MVFNNIHTLKKPKKQTHCYAERINLNWLISLTWRISQASSTLSVWTDQADKW